ncbi:MAG: hypothetical protein KDC34_18640 [Saprospiraceae bacterium]|nr:hypothetical protein [Saprospiraceae bacterium]
MKITTLSLAAFFFYFLVALTNLNAQVNWIGGFQAAHQQKQVSKIYENSPVLAQII